MVIEYNNNKPIQLSIIKPTYYYVLKVETDFCVQSYMSSDMHYFVLFLEITTIQMLLFFAVLNSKYETKGKCHYFKTSNISCDLFFLLLIQS